MVSFDLPQVRRRPLWLLSSLPLLIRMRSRPLVYRRAQLVTVFDEVIDVKPEDTGDAAALKLLGRPELGVTATKISCWTLTHYTKCVFVDADTLVLTNVDDLFDRPSFAAAPDVGWPDCFNSGVFVFTPSQSTYADLVKTLTEHGSFDGGDQGLLNTYFSSWSTDSPAHRLPFVYNMTQNASYGYVHLLLSTPLSICGCTEDWCFVLCSTWPCSLLKFHTFPHFLLPSGTQSSDMRAIALHCDTDMRNCIAACRAPSCVCPPLHIDAQVCTGTVKVQGHGEDCPLHRRSKAMDGRVVITVG